MMPEMEGRSLDMLACHLNRQLDVPLYEQLYEHIKKEITAGRLVFGSKLPSKRKLSEYLKVSQNTVETAYDQLIAEGYVEGIERKGYYVLAFEDLEYTPSDNISANIPKATNDNDFLYYFIPGWIDTMNFPFSKWRKYAKNTLDEKHHTLLLLGDRQGEYELRKEIARYLYHARGVRCTPEEIIIGAGSEVLLQQLIHLLGAEVSYGIEDPGYHVMSHLLRSYPNRMHLLDVDEEGLQVQSLRRKKLDVVYVTPSHHFPYGSVLSVNRRIQLLNWAHSSPTRYVIEDDYDSEFRYSGKAIPSLQSMDQGKKVIYLGSFSKSLIPSLRISYMVLPKELLQGYHEQDAYYQCSVSRLDQHILTQFMQAGDFERHLNRMRKIYRRKLERTLEMLKPHQDKLTVIGEHSGLHIVLRVHNGMDEQELINRANRARLQIYPLSRFTMENRSQPMPHLILGFAGIPERELETAIGMLLKSWDFVG